MRIGDCLNRRSLGIASAYFSSLRGYATEKSIQACRVGIQGRDQCLELSRRRSDGDANRLNWWGQRTVASTYDLDLYRSAHTSNEY